MAGAISFGPDLDAALTRATDIARALSHARIGTEHALLALLDDPCSAEMLHALKVDQDTLRQALTNGLHDEPPAMGAPPRPSDALQRVIARATQYVQISGVAEITGAHVILGMFAERCPAADLLQEQGVIRSDAVDYIKRTIKPPA
jgi:ATP-dependent Clp protease ATP-binding subunit ClpA